MIAVLFIRSYERGERVYYAMLSRGFSGSIRTLDDSRIRGADVLFAAIIFLILTLILIS
jgi:cobalt/nickel transport system permease protein